MKLKSVYYVWDEDWDSYKGQWHENFEEMCEDCLSRFNADLLLGKFEKFEINGEIERDKCSYCGEKSAPFGDILARLDNEHE